MIVHKKGSIQFYKINYQTFNAIKSKNEGGKGNGNTYKCWYSFIIYSMKGGNIVKMILVCYIEINF